MKAKFYSVLVLLIAALTFPTAVVQAQPTGSKGGKFTVASGKQVRFSQGNLQYNKTTQEWSFMDHQYDMVETDGQYVGENYANQNIVSLFGWGTSGWNNGNVYYQPWDTQDNGNYNQGDGYGPTDGTDFTYDLTGEYSLADWGVHNFINNTTGAWRTLTQSEWIYVFITRTGIRYAYAQITGTSNGTVNGMILFPDDY